MNHASTALNDSPLSKYFLSGYVSRTEDPSNFPPNQLPEVIQRYESIFADSLKILGLPKESLRARPEFKFDSGDPANLEAGIAVLRVVCTLESEGFASITLVRPGKEGGADIACQIKGYKVCCEVKTITKQSRASRGYGFEDELYEKVNESIGKARSQLDFTARELGCSAKLLACVMNWKLHTLYLEPDNYYRIVKRLEHDGSLNGIDGVLFVNSGGGKFMFLTEQLSTAGALTV